MPTTSVPYTWPSDAQGITDAATTSDVTIGWHASEGSPSTGCLRSISTAANLAAVTEYGRSPGGQTWQSWGGVPGGVEVESARITGIKTKGSAPFNCGLTLNIRLKSGGVTVHSGTLFTREILAGQTDMGWQDHGSQTLRSITSAYKPSSTSIQLEFEAIHTSGASADTVEILIDTMTIELTYTQTLYTLVDGVTVVSEVRGVVSVVIPLSDTAVGLSAPAVGSWPVAFNDNPASISEVILQTLAGGGGVTYTLTDSGASGGGPSTPALLYTLADSASVGDVLSAIFSLLDSVVPDDLGGIDDSPSLTDDSHPVILISDRGSEGSTPSIVAITLALADSGTASAIAALLYGLLDSGESGGGPAEPTVYAAFEHVGVGEVIATFFSLPPAITDSHAATDSRAASATAANTTDSTHRSAEQSALRTGGPSAQVIALVEGAAGSEGPFSPPPTYTIREAMVTSDRLLIVASTPVGINDSGGTRESWHIVYCYHDSAKAVESLSPYQVTVAKTDSGVSSQAGTTPTPVLLDDPADGSALGAARGAASPGSAGLSSALVDSGAGRDSSSPQIGPRTLSDRGDARDSGRPEAAVGKADTAAVADSRALVTLVVVFTDNGREGGGPRLPALVMQVASSVAGADAIQVAQSVVYSERAAVGDRPVIPAGMSILALDTSLARSTSANPTTAVIVEGAGIDETAAVQNAILQAQDALAARESVAHTVVSGSSSSLIPTSARGRTDPLDTVPTFEDFQDRG